MKKYTVLTFIINKYEVVREIIEKDPEAEYILVTDDPTLTSETWEVVCDMNIPGVTAFDKCLYIRYNWFKYANTDICVRVDGSIHMKRSIAPLINLFESGQYDICLMPHPFHNNFVDEYSMWVADRGYPSLQADRCMEYYTSHGYDLNYKGLIQINFSILRRNERLLAFESEVWDLIKELGENDSLERIDQIVYSYVLNSRYSSLNILPVSEQIIRSYYMQFYEHGSNNMQNVNSSYDYEQPDQRYLFNKLVTCYYLATPIECFAQREKELLQTIKDTQEQLRIYRYEVQRLTSGSCLNRALKVRKKKIKRHINLLSSLIRRNDT